MLRVLLSASVVAAAVFLVAPDSAGAQFAPLAMTVMLDSTWDVSVNGNQRVRCRGNLNGSDEPVYLRLEPEVGAVAWNLRRFYCGDVVLDLFVELKTEVLQSEPHTVYPNWANLFVMINVVYDSGAGASATVLEHNNFVFFRDGAETSYTYPVRFNTPGVVIHEVYDRMVSWLEP